MKKKHLIPPALSSKVKTGGEVFSSYVHSRWEHLTMDSRRRVQFILATCVVFAVAVLAAFYALDLLTMENAERTIYRWHQSGAKF